MRKLKLLLIHENMFGWYACNLHIHIKYIQKEISCLKKQQLFIHLGQTKHRDVTVSKILLLIAGASRCKGGRVSPQAVRLRRFITKDVGRLTCKNKKLKNTEGA